MQATAMGRRPHVLVCTLLRARTCCPSDEVGHQDLSSWNQGNFCQHRVHTRKVSIPDGMNPGEDRNDVVKLTESILAVMPGYLKDLIVKINGANRTEKITCVIADVTAGWALEVAAEMGIKRAAVWPAGPANLAMALHVPQLLEEGIIDSDGTLLKHELIHLGENIPLFCSTDLLWNSSDDPKIREVIFGYSSRVGQYVKLSNWLLCNASYELDSPACDLIPEILPIGPLLASNHPGHSAGNFWPDDSTCLKWLNKQPAGSVIYIAFGSLAVLTQHQFYELALGIKLVARPFLWVVRSEFNNGLAAKHPEGFMQTLSEYGKIVEWTDQEKVLANPSIAYFLTHCGWNSTMEGVSMGVPFLCWPQFSDQFCNRNYICDIWKVGLGLDPDGNGIVTRHEIKTKIDKLFSDDGIKVNALNLKEIVGGSVSEDGSSSKNFKAFIELVKH